jgi:ribosomal-protein-alanine N-acetyltransferase
MNDVFKTFPHLQTPDLILRQIRLTDAPAVFDILADAEVARYYDEDPFTNVSQASKLIEFWASAFERRQAIRWGIARRDDGRLIGTCGYYGLHAWHSRAALGYELARPHWRQGIMTEALRAIIAFGFEQAGLNRIQADVMPANRASIKLLENLGFVNEGLLREYENWDSKGYVDLYRFSLLRREFGTQMNADFLIGNAERRRADTEMRRV